MRGVPADKSAAMMAPKQKVEKPMRIMGRLFGYILRRYKLHCLGVLLFIFGSTAATVAGNLFMKTLIDDYIVPYIGEGGASDFGPLLAALLKMGCVFLFGVLCTLLYNRIMVYVSQGTMRAIRDDLFRHMERLPIRYFDTHAHGDIMSIYTNDIDTLRQMISQSMPQLVSSAVTIVSVFCSMLALSLPLSSCRQAALLADLGVRGVKLLQRYQIRIALERVQRGADGQHHHGGYGRQQHGPHKVLYIGAHLIGVGLHSSLYFLWHGPSPFYISTSVRSSENVISSRVTALFSRRLSGRYTMRWLSLPRHRKSRFFCAKIKRPSTR